MKIFLCLLFTAVLIQGCKNLPSPGKYEKKGLGDIAYLFYTGEEVHVNTRYPGRFAKQDFIIALGQSPSAQYMTAGRPRYYCVISDDAAGKTNLRIITLEVLERDYKRK